MYLELAEFLSVTISGDYFSHINLIRDINLEIVVILDFVKVMEVLFWSNRLRLLRFKDITDKTAVWTIYVYLTNYAMLRSPTSSSIVFFSMPLGTKDTGRPHGASTTLGAAGLGGGNEGSLKVGITLTALHHCSKQNRGTESHTCRIYQTSFFRGFLRNPDSTTVVTNKIYPPFSNWSMFWLYFLVNHPACLFSLSFCLYSQWIQLAHPSMPIRLFW